MPSRPKIFIRTHLSRTIKNVHDCPPDPPSQPMILFRCRMRRVVRRRFSCAISGFPAGNKCSVDRQTRRHFDISDCLMDGSCDKGIPSDEEGGAISSPNRSNAMRDVTLDATVSLLMLFYLSKVIFCFIFDILIFLSVRIRVGQERRWKKRLGFALGFPFSSLTQEFS